MGCCFTASAAVAVSPPPAGMVTKCPGFKEHAFRLLFAYEDNFPEAEPALLTILPSGVLETIKILYPERERGLIAYTFNQTIDDAMAGKTVEFPDSTQWHGKAYTQTPFVHDRKVGNKHTLVQTWPTKINDKFKKDFTLTDHNPDTEKFQCGAVTDYKTCIEEMFGKDATKKVPIKYGHRVTDNNNACYLGMTEDLLSYLKNNSKAMIDLCIKEVTADGFVAAGTDDKGNPIEKPFKMEKRKTYVVYKKEGWETMGCCKTKEQFDKECEFLDKGVIVPCTQS